VVLCLSQDGACTDSFENFRDNSLKGGLSNDITINPPLFSLVNTFKVIFAVSSLFYYTVCAKLANFINAGFASYKSLSLIVILQGLSVVRELGCTDTSPGCGYNGNCEDKVCNYEFYFFSSQMTTF